MDAWQKLSHRDIEDYPDLEGEVRSFGIFLNEVCKIERKKGTQIIHSCSSSALHLGIMDEIEVASEDMIMGEEGNTLWGEFHASIDELYWCGFHFGRCVHSQAIVASGDQANIVLNLCLVFPQDTWKEWGNPTVTFQDFPKMRYYLWRQTGLDEVNIS